MKRPWRLASLAFIALAFASGCCGTSANPEFVALCRASLSNCCRSSDCAPHCNQTRCGCLSSPCSAGLCDTTSGMCVECLGNTDCPVGTCESHVCTECTQDVDCMDPAAPRCVANACVACTSDVDCSAPVPFCYTMENRCVQCLQPLDCDDGDSCTTDRCSVAPDFVCTNSPRDEDGDGHVSASCGGDDCDDAAATVFPGADEVCDGIDQNCDGIIDEGLYSASTPVALGFAGSATAASIVFTGTDYLVAWTTGTYAATRAAAIDGLGVVLGTVQDVGTGYGIDLEEHSGFVSAAWNTPTTGDPHGSFAALSTAAATAGRPNWTCRTPLGDRFYSGASVASDGTTFAVGGVDGTAVSPTATFRLFSRGGGTCSALTSRVGFSVGSAAALPLDVAWDAAGGFLVVYSWTNTFSEAELWGQRLTTSAVGASAQLRAQAGAHLHHPRLAHGPAGTWGLAYTSTSTGMSPVRGAQFVEVGDTLPPASVSGPLTLSSGGVLGGGAFIAIFGRPVSLTWTGSEYGVAWLSDDGGAVNLHLARLQPGPSRIGADVTIPSAGLPLGSNNFFSTSVAWNGTEYAVVWDVSNTLYFARVGCGPFP